MDSPAFQVPVATINGTAVPPLILCDQAFPLTAHLIKPFSHRACLDDDMKLYNYHLSKARRVVENAFGRMKARFRFCMKRMECKLDTAQSVIRACCVLNNICEQNSEHVMHEWTTDAHITSALYEQPQRTTDVQSPTGAAVRAAMVHHFKQRAGNSGKSCTSYFIHSGGPKKCTIQLTNFSCSFRCRSLSSISLPWDDSKASRSNLCSVSCACR